MEFGYLHLLSPNIGQLKMANVDKTKDNMV